jgi:uncharacterized membrane protein
MNTVIVFFSLLSSGLLVGNELAVALFIHPVLYSVSNEAHARVVKPLAGRLGRFMPPWYAITLVLAILQLLIEPKGPQSWRLCCAAAGLMALIIILTIVLMVPTNNRIARSDPDRLPPNWLSMRQRWDLYHRIRVLLLGLVFSLLILSALK